MNIKHVNQFNIIFPHPELQNYILYYNIIFPGAVIFNDHYTLLPDACGTLSLAFDGNSVNAELWGASATSARLGAEPNNYKVLMLIQLSPYGLYQITRLNQAEFADQRILLKDIDAELFHALLQAFITAESVSDLAAACDKILYQRMDKPVVSDALLLSAKAIADHHGHIQVREVARQASYSERQLNRLFLNQIGTNIKNYARLVRFHYVLKQLETTPGLWAAISQQAGYFDQAHFGKDFKAISGVTPQMFLERISDFHYDGAGPFTEQ